jgi:glutamate synthase (NADPH/NADH) large chain
VKNHTPFSGPGNQLPGEQHPQSNKLNAESRRADFAEHDACAIVAAVRKSGEATHGNLKRALAALSLMGHRSGDVNGEGDGCGVLTDIPRRIWAEALEREGKPSWLAEDRRFFVGHLMIPHAMQDDARPRALIARMIGEAGADVLLERPCLTRPNVLGRIANAQAPLLWQVAGLMRTGPLEDVERSLFGLALAIERALKVDVASLSSYSVVYKVRGAIETLYQYYPELRSPDFTTAITLGHARYSTNTASSFERVQPFSLLGHNGEINTIARLREQAEMLGVQLVEGGSDSQDLDRSLAGLIHAYGFSLTEAMEILFPPILSEVEKLSPELQVIYRYYRQAFGPYAQGPAAIISRYGDECVFSVDALGLRPLWFGDTEKEYFFSSEKGVYHLDTMRANPRPLSPGEKMSLHVHRNRDVQVFDYPAIQQRMVTLTRRRFGSLEALKKRLKLPEPRGERPPAAPGESDEDRESPAQASLQLERRLAAFGWWKEDREWVQSLAQEGREPLGSLGYDGPLAALSAERQNVADHFKEAVAVVTNPAVDREREVEHFSTQTLIGPRPPLNPSELCETSHLVAECPLLLGGEAGQPLLSAAGYGEVAGRSGVMPLGEVLAAFEAGQVASLVTATLPGEGLAEGLERLAGEAVAAACSGRRAILLDDREAFQQGLGWIDPMLAVAVVDRALRKHFTEAERVTGPLPVPVNAAGRVDLNRMAASQPVNLRREAALILRSGAIRNLHDLIMALGLGADAVAPYLLLEVAVDDASRQLEPAERAARLVKTVKTLRVGLEKTISTMGIHELRGYGRLFASIGLSQPVAAAMDTLNYNGSEGRGLTWADLEADAAARSAILAGQARPQLSRVNHFYPKIWKAAGQVARGEADPQAFEEQAQALAKTNPVSLRHILDFCYPPGQPSLVDPSTVDAGLTAHALPFVIASMSFGSQGETAFRAYAQAAYWLNIIALSGEGGELPDLMGKYPHNRGLQIASGRFGVSAEMINSSNLLEIKIGQGAKPGEGGHLPARKVTARVAAARHAQPGTDLISPSNNHDIYSIEDLSQFIEELKTANPKARVAVKVPVVPGIGIISVGIAKAEADIIYLSGYDGGTGAARKHSLRHAGLPAEIGVVEAHRALTEAGLRQKVEIWCDGGARTAADVVKMICLGANRVGFGTLAMVAAGCTICRDCQSGTCHVGITTQIESQEQAQALGLRRFIPQDSERAVAGLINLFSALGEGVKRITARLGFERTQDLVGRADLLVQSAFHDRLDLGDLLTPVMDYPATKSPQYAVVIQRPQLVAEAALLPNAPALQEPPARTVLGRGPLRRPRNHLTTVISNMVMETLAVGEEQISFEDDKVTPVDRALGTHLTGALTRFRRNWMWLPGHGGVGGDQESWRLPLNFKESNGNGDHLREATLRFFGSSVPGNGLGAYNTHPMTIVVEGGAQDGVAKGMLGGRVIILKGYNHDGELIDGSVGKSLAYGAIGGLVIVQGDTDSRACVRLSGADVIIGGEITQPLNDSLGFIGARANVKGFLCEYMTSGRVLVLGDPGPWMCAGMTGGVLYLRLQPHLNFDRRAIARRLAQGAKVAVHPVDDGDYGNLRQLLSAYAEELARNHQVEEAGKALDLLGDWQNTFVKVVPQGVQEDQRYATE